MKVDVKKPVLKKPAKRVRFAPTVDTNEAPPKPKYRRPKKSEELKKKQEAIAENEKMNEPVEIKKPRGRPPKTVRKLITPPHPAPLEEQGRRLRSRPPWKTTV